MSDTVLGAMGHVTINRKSWSACTISLSLFVNLLIYPLNHSLFLLQGMDYYWVLFLKISLLQMLLSNVPCRSKDQAVKNSKCNNITINS